MIQRMWRGYRVRKQFHHQLSIMRMERCFRYFDKMSYDLQKGAILFIIRHWKKFVARRKQEREEEKKKGNSKKSKGKEGTKPTTGAKSGTNKDATSGKRGSISKTSRASESVKKQGSGAASQSSKHEAPRSQKSVVLPSNASQKTKDEKPAD